MRRREVVIMGHFNMQFKRISSAMTTHQILSRCSRWMLAAVIFLLTTHDKRRHPLLLLPLIFHNLLFIHSSVLSDSLQNIILNADLSSFSCIVGMSGRQAEPQSARRQVHNPTLMKKNTRPPRQMLYCPAEFHDNLAVVGGEFTGGRSGRGGRSGHRIRIMIFPGGVSRKKCRIKRRN